MKNLLNDGVCAEARCSYESQVPATPCEHIESDAVNYKINSYSAIPEMRTKR
ncbi:MULTISPECIES: hypothetical protein [unclassified Saccharicrinis]|uniref:hypothetical protein n=1 Tax=unclassified Saccharicrinis TaxID=2646859 RepID=UPI003D35883E